MKVIKILIGITIIATIGTSGIILISRQKNHTYTKYDISQALNIANRVKSMRGGKEEPTINTQIGALKQPTFPGAVGKEGAIVTFDEKNNPIHGITTRTFDRKTGKHYEVKELTSAELKEASEALQSYYYEILNFADRQNIKTIVVFSESFKMAVCESILNRRLDRDYYMGASLPKKTASIYMQQAGTKLLIAEEKIYYSDKN